LKITVGHKLFASVMLVALLVIGIFVGLTSWHLRQGFSSYIAKGELSDQQAIVNRLEALYSARGSWDFLRTDSSAWTTLVSQNTSARTHIGRYAPISAYENCVGKRAGDVVSHETPQGVVRAVCRHTPDGLAARPEQQESKDAASANRPPPRPSSGQLPGLAGRLVLFDGNNQRVAGVPFRNSDILVKRPIGPAAKPVGELALIVAEAPSGVEQTFLEQSIQIIRLVAACALIVSLIAAYLLSKNFVEPLRKITLGTRQLASGQYQTRIEASRSDEFGDLIRDFNRLAHALEQHQNNRRLWVAQTSHELRTPVSILRAHIEALIDGVRIPNPQEFEVLQKEVLHLSKLIGDLNELALADSGALAFKKESVDLPELLIDCLGSFYEKYNNAKISLSVQRCAAAPVFGDASRLQQLFSNLLENSLRYTAAGGCVDINCSRTGSAVVITFDDTPPGVELTALASLFDPFFRSNASRQSSTNGSGLGLAICKSIVVAHQGAITAKLSPRGGLRIEIVLPLLESRT
jgi:two-component system sensor histidine kinase BaeS